MNPRAPGDYNDVSFHTSQPKESILNNQSDNNKLIKKNIKNAPGTLQKSIKCSVDTEQDDVPSCDELKVIDSVQADDESSSRHSDLSKVEIESENDASMSTIIRNNHSESSDEEFPPKSGHLSNGKMKTSKNNVITEAHPFNHTIVERSYTQDTEAKHESRRQVKRKYMEEIENSYVSERRSINKEEKYMLGKTCNRNSIISKCNDTLKAHSNSYDEATSHREKEQRLPNIVSLEESKDVQCVSATGSEDDHFRCRKRKRNSLSINWPSRENSCHSQRRKNKSRKTKGAHTFVKAVKDDDYNSQNYNCDESRNSDNEVTRKGVLPRTQINLKKNKFSTTTNSHNMALSNRSVDAKFTRRGYVSPSRKYLDRNGWLNKSSLERKSYNKYRAYRDASPERPDCITPWYTCEPRYLSRNNRDRSGWQNQTSPEREPRNRSSNYRDILPECSDCYAIESWNSRRHISDRPGRLNTSPKTMSCSRRDYKHKLPDCHDCTSPRRGYMQHESWDSNEMRVSDTRDDRYDAQNLGLHICERFTRDPKSNHECSDLHVCKYFLLSKCSRTDCKFGHNLRDQYNSKVLEIHNLANLGDENLKRLMRQIGKRNISTIPLICKFYNNEGGCSKRKCMHLHICTYYITENCRFNAKCKRSHNFKDKQPKHILNRYGINIYEYDDIDIRSLLRKTLQNGEVKLKRHISQSISQQ